MREGLTPEVSLGTHFFNELVETDMLYFALFPEREHDYLNRDLLESAPNRLSELLPEASQWVHVVRVLDSHQWNNGKALRLIADSRKQSVVCFRER
jgi:pyruvate,water dikinase